MTAAAHAMILAERAARVEAEAVAACPQAVNVSTGALIAHLKLEIEKLRRALYGSHSERKARLLELGLGSPPANARDAANPRPSPDAYLETSAGFLEVWNSARVG
jgi:hypothetical protein